MRSHRLGRGHLFKIASVKRADILRCASKRISPFQLEITHVGEHRFPCGEVVSFENHEYGVRHHLPLAITQINHELHQKGGNNSLIGWRNLEGEGQFFILSHERRQLFPSKKILGLDPWHREDLIEPLCIDTGDLQRKLEIADDRDIPSLPHFKVGRGIAFFHDAPVTEHLTRLFMPGPEAAQIDTGWTKIMRSWRLWFRNKYELQLATFSEDFAHMLAFGRRARLRFLDLLPPLEGRHLVETLPPLSFSTLAEHLLINLAVIENIWANGPTPQANRRSILFTMEKLARLQVFDLQSEPMHFHAEGILGIMPLLLSMQRERNEILIDHAQALAGGRALVAIIRAYQERFAREVLYPRLNEKMWSIEEFQAHSYQDWWMYFARKGEWACRFAPLASPAQKFSAGFDIFSSRLAPQEVNAILAHADFEQNFAQRLAAYLGIQGVSWEALLGGRGLDRLVG